MAKIQNLALDRNRTPMYLQVAAVVRHRIESGHWKEGDQISTAVELMDEFGVARVTIQQAVRILQEEGLLSAFPGRGTFVSGRPKQKYRIDQAGDLKSLAEAIKSNVVKVASIEERRGPPLLDEEDVVLASSYAHIRSVQYNGQDPFSVGTVYVLTEIFEQEKKRFLKQPALPLLLSMKQVKVAQAFQDFTIGVAGLETSKLLQIGLGEPTAESRLVLLDASGVAIFIAHFHYSRDHFAMRRILRTG
jgi:GntR family transcriptional regulator